jgi:hypothetical protein
MGTRKVEVLLADEPTWNQFTSVVKKETGRDWRPPGRDGFRTVTPFVAKGQSWKKTIDKIIDELDAKQDQIRYLRIMAHGPRQDGSTGLGFFDCGVPLRYDDLSSINEFQRLRRFCVVWATNVYISGCQVAAEGPCQTGFVQSGGQKVGGLCLGPFTGDTSKPGYLLMRRLADALNAPVHGSPWMQAFMSNADGWKVEGAKLTVGPGGGWVYDPAGANGDFKTVFGSP